jgi:hypothetical protein
MTKIDTLLRFYVIAALVAAAILSPLAYSFAPIILLAWFLFRLRWPLSSPTGLATAGLLFFALPVLYVQRIAAFPAALISLPFLLLVARELEKTAPEAALSPGRRPRRFSRLAAGLLLMDILIAALGFLLNLPVLLISGAFWLIALTGLGLYTWRRFPRKPVLEETATQRILAGQDEPFSAELQIKTTLGSVLWLESGDDWIKLDVRRLSLKASPGNRARVALKGHIKPPLAGAGSLRIKAVAVDCWGLTETCFEIEPLKLHVIPRARYAVWLAQKYLTGTGEGALPLISNLGAFKATRGLRQGIEFYGNRQYQAGDSLKTIDWKHSAKYHELVVKEFTEFRGMPAILLINLTAASAEEADKLAYNIVMTALTLGQENIPASLAVYNHERVLLTTASLAASELLVNTLQIIQQIAIVPSPLKYLAAPDIGRLKANTTRLSQSTSQPATVLADLMRLEYSIISRNSRQNPCSQALAAAEARLSAQATVVAISLRHHDAEALALQTYRLAQKGIAVVGVG